MVRLLALTVVLAVLSCVVPAFDIAFTGCKQELQMVNIENFVEKLLKDTKLLAQFSNDLWPERPPEHGNAIELKAKQPLIPDLFGSISSEEWSTISWALLVAKKMMTQETPKDAKPFIHLTCMAKDTPKRPDDHDACEGSALMEVLVNKGGKEGDHLILMCPQFWKDITSNQHPSFNRFFIDAQERRIDICGMKPIDLGSTFAARLLYHELFHIIPEIKSGLFAGAEWKDRGRYLVDENDVEKSTFLVTMTGTTWYAKQTPDTYAFWAILSLRQHICKWEPTWSAAAQFAQLPLVTIKHDSDEKGPALYGDAVPCPDSDPNIRNPPLTKPTIDTFKNPQDRWQDFLWCKLQDQANGQCPTGWVRKAIEVLKTPKKMEQLNGCFINVQATVKSENSRNQQVLLGDTNGRLVNGANLKQTVFD